jgi:hypothetical protein
MGPEADDIFASFKLNDENKKKYTKVKEKFDNHFIVRRNVIFERAKFNKRKQEDSENVETFVTSHRLSFPLISRLRLYGIDS